MRYLATVLVFIRFIYGTDEKNATDNVCGKNGEDPVCCSGYFKLNSRCEVFIIECFGASGSNCSQPCNNVTYGYQCRKKCSCNHNEVCNKYVGCLQIVSEEKSGRRNNLLIHLIGFGSSILSLCLIFIGVMFYRWRQYLKSSFPFTERNEGFDVDLFSPPSNQEINTENYFDVRESRMLGASVETHMRERGEYRINSTEYNHLFTPANVTGKTIDKHNTQYDTVDVRCGRNKPWFITCSEFADDDCYVSLSLKTNTSNGLSKSCPDLRVKMS